MLAGEKCEGTSKVMVCLVVAQWLFVEILCLRGEGRQGELMVRDCGEVRQGKGGGVRAIVAMYNQSSANTGTHFRTYTH